MTCSRTLRSDAGEAGTRSHSVSRHDASEAGTSRHPVSRHALYYCIWATALLKVSDENVQMHIQARLNLCGTYMQKLPFSVSYLTFKRK